MGFFFEITFSFTLSRKELNGKQTKVIISISFMFSCNPFPFLTSVSANLTPFCPFDVRK